MKDKQTLPLKGGKSGFNAMVKDAAFKADAIKQKLELDPGTGEQIEKMLAELYQTPKAAAERVKEFRKAGAGEKKIKRKKKKNLKKNGGPPRTPQGRAASPRPAPGLSA